VYANVLIKCIESYDLHQWDMSDEERTKWFAELNKTEKDTAQLQDASSPDFSAEPATVVKPAERVYVFNDIKCVTLLRGESLNDLATKYEIGINRLMRYNDVTDPSQIQSGDRVYLQPKRHNGDQDIHTVQIGETMFSISRDHGIQLEELYEKNLLTAGDEPLQGEIIYLREKRPAPPKILIAPDSDQVELTNVSVSESAADQFHVVSKGDTLFSVAKKYNLSIVELKELNHLYSENLYVGERLKVIK
jgi:membrane-bound lytic murein transglycosylase D